MHLSERCHVVWESPGCGYMGKIISHTKANNSYSIMKTLALHVVTLFMSCLYLSPHTSNVKQLLRYIHKQTVTMAWMGVI